MKKKVIAVLIGLAICGVLAGCGGNDETAEETTEVVEEEAEAEDEADSEEVAEEEVEEGEWVYDEENELWVWNEYDENGEAVDSGITIRVLTEDEIESESEVVSDEAADDSTVEIFEETENE